MTVKGTTNKAIDFVNDSDVEVGAIYSDSDEMCLVSINSKNLKVLSAAILKLQSSTQITFDADLDPASASLNIGNSTYYCGDVYLSQLALKEITTPTATANWGKLYTKNTNKLFFQSGDGVEHELAYA